MNLLVLLTIVVGKDIYVSGLERNFNFRPPHILQEVTKANNPYSFFIINCYHVVGGGQSSGNESDELLDVQTEHQSKQASGGGQ